MRFEHPIFQGPLPVDSTTVEKVDPYSGKTIRAWRVHEDIGRPGLVASRRRFVDSPDSEILAGGINMKGDRGVPLVREGNIFLWGFAASPSEMTEAGIAALVNSVAYMKGFDGRVPSRRAGVIERDRWRGILDSPYVKPSRLSVYFGPELVAAHGEDKAAYVADLEKRAPFLHVARGSANLRIDPEAEELGVPTDSLALIRAALEADDERGRRILDRYWPEDDLVAARPRSVEDLDALGDTVVFSESHGYRWLSRAPEAGPERWEIEDAFDALETSEPTEFAPAIFSACFVGGYNTPELASDKRLGLVTLAVRADVLDGWHVTVEGGDSGLAPVSIEVDLPPGMMWYEPGYSIEGERRAVEGVVEGHGRLTWTRDVWLRCEGGSYTVPGRIRFQACDATRCLEPVEFDFEVRLKVR